MSHLKAYFPNRWGSRLCNFGCNEDETIEHIIECKNDDNKEDISQIDYTKLMNANSVITPGHSVSNITITIIEKVKIREESYRKHREKYHINKFNTYYRGLNKQM